MPGPLAALLLALIQPGWAANVRGVPAGAHAGLFPVPLTLRAQALDSRFYQLPLPAGLSGPRPAASPILPARAMTIPSAGTLISRPAAGAANPGRTALERLAQEAPFPTPAPSDLEGGKDFADRGFEFKLGAPSADAEALVEAPSNPEFAATRERHAPTPHSGSDDGGGPDYPYRIVRFNGHDFRSVYFRPNVPVEDKIIEAIDASNDSIRIALYEFKLSGVLEALKRARQRKVRVEIILDHSNVFPENDPDAEYQQRRSNEIWGLIREGFDFSVLRGVTPYGIMHNKFAVFDGKMVEFGSYNWSFTAETAHYENANFSTKQDRVHDLSAYWDYLKSLSVPFAQARDYDWPKSVPAPPQASALIQFNGATLPSCLFMPDQTAFEDAVVTAIDAANESVDLAMFALRSARIARALVRAKTRRKGLRVRVLMDESQSQSEYFGPFAAWLASQGVKVRILAGPDPESDYPRAEKMHHKFLIVDGKLVETGSPNHTKRASMDNYENAHFLDDPADAAAYAFAFSHMFSIARPYPKPNAVPRLPTDEELLNDILNPPPPKPRPPEPDQPPLPAPGVVTFHAEEFPSSALLPFDPIEPLWVRAIDSAQKSIRLAIYEFTSEPILEALRRAKLRGLRVELVLDRSHLYTSGISHDGQPRKPKPQVVALAKEFNVKVLRGKNSGVMHNKFLLLDDELDDAMVAFGSYNPTDVAEKHHFENEIFTNAARRVEYYRRYFDWMRDLAEEIDFDKLDEILNRTTQAAAESWAEEEAAWAEPERKGDIVPPPEDPDQPILFNGESFPLELFSPYGRIEETIIRAIHAAKFSIEIAMFSFYSQKIADALLEARDANPELKIRILMDHSQAKLSRLDEWFVYHGFDIRLSAGPHGEEGDPMYEKMHNKLALIDGKLLETGSFNYSPNAENNNFENANFIDDPLDVARFAAYFERLWRQGWKPPPRRNKASHPPATAAYPQSGWNAGQVADAADMGLPSFPRDFAGHFEKEDMEDMPEN